MNFKEALIAHLNGEKVECYDGQTWFDFMEIFGHARIEAMETYGSGWKFRLAPRTIRVNGVEVPAPESVAPTKGDVYFLPCIHGLEDREMLSQCVWKGSEFDNAMLARGLVYLTQVDTLARAKAMLLTESVQ